jgi:hypothetical protein
MAQLGRGAAGGRRHRWLPAVMKKKALGGPGSSEQGRLGSRLGLRLTATRALDLATCRRRLAGAKRRQSRGRAWVRAERERVYE